MSNISESSERIQKMERAKSLANEIKPLITALPYSRNFSQLKFLDSGEALLGRETFKTNGKMHALYPVTYYQYHRQFVLKLDDVSLPIEALLQSDADILVPNSITVESTGLYAILSHLTKHASELVENGQLVNRNRVIDDYIFLYLSASLLIDQEKLTENKIKKTISSWLNTGIEIERIIFFMRLKNDAYTPETIDEYKCMPLDEII